MRLNTFNSYFALRYVNCKHRIYLRLRIPKSYSFSVLIVFFSILISFGVVFAQEEKAPPKKKTSVRQNIPKNANINTDTTNVRRRGSGQGILDDTTKMVYGPTTTKYFLVKNWFEIDTTTYEIDTSIVNMQRYNFPARNDYTYYDQGNVGTPLNSFFYVFPSTLGKRLGQDAMDPHIVPEDKFKYYNTRSPYSDWYYAQGGSGRAVLDINMSQNVTPNFNIGFRYFRLSSRFMLGQRPQQRNNLQGQTENFHLHTNFTSNNNRYKLLAHFNANTQKIQESGGVDLDILLNDTTGIYDLFEPENRGIVANRLQGVNTLSITRSAYLYHQFSVFDSSSLLQVFNDIKATTYQYQYRDINANDNTNFYPLELPTDLTETFHQIRFEEIDVRYGGKGRIGNLFYSGWLRTRQYAQSTEYEVEGNDEPNSLIPITLESDRFFGAQGSFFFGKDSSFVYTKANLKFENQLNGSGNLMKAKLTNRLFDATFQRGSYAPTQMQSYYVGDIFEWTNPDFVNQEAQRIELGVNLPSKKFNVRLSANQTSLSNHIIFDTLALPVQIDSTLTYQQLGLDFDIKTGHFRHIGKVLYTTTADSSVLRMPEWLINYQVFLEKDFFDKAIYAQIGMDFHWNSKVFSYGYMPVTQQFHLQDRYEAGDYLQADFFINFRINRVRMFIKVNNVLQGAFSKKGYYVSPHYMAQPREFEFGVRWLLFD